MSSYRADQAWLHSAPPHRTIPAEHVTIGQIIDDERFAHQMRVGHIATGPKWVTFRSFHPKANIFPNVGYRVRRGETVRVRM